MASSIVVLIKTIEFYLQKLELRKSSFIDRAEKA